ncbi:MAG: hypothetical protein AAF570_13280, partial [Bacteroidota bacterium]
FNDRWHNMLGWDYDYPSDPGNNGNFEIFPNGDPSGTQLPLPNNANFIAGINAFIDQHNIDFGTSIPNITSIASLNQIVIPASPDNAELQIVDFMRNVVHNTFVPLTEIPVVYEHLNGPSYQPIPKKQVIRDRNGELLHPSHPDFDMAPMMKVIGPDAGAIPPKTDDETQFTDFGLDGASNAKYFYIAREFNLQMKTGPYSPVLGPIHLVNTAPPKPVEVVKVTALLENRAFNIDPAIELEINAYAESQRIQTINVFRATKLEDGLTVRTMKHVQEIDVATAGLGSGATWKIRDAFEDLDYVPYGDPLFYRLTVSRAVQYEDRDGVLVEELQPSEISKLTVTNIVEAYSPEAPDVAYYSQPITPAKELNQVTLRWDKMVHNGNYTLYKRNNSGNWVEIHRLQSNDDVLTLALVDTDLASGTLLVEDADGNSIYHFFKVVPTNFAGMRSLDEKILTIYNPSTWNDIVNL